MEKCLTCIILNYEFNKRIEDIKKAFQSGKLLYFSVNSD